MIEEKIFEDKSGNIIIVNKTEDNKVAVRVGCETKILDISDEQIADVKMYYDEIGAHLLFKDINKDVLNGYTSYDVEGSKCVEFNVDRYHIEIEDMQDGEYICRDTRLGTMKVNPLNFYNRSGYLKGDKKLKVNGIGDQLYMYNVRFADNKEKILYWNDKELICATKSGALLWKDEDLCGREVIRNTGKGFVHVLEDDKINIYNIQTGELVKSDKEFIWRKEDVCIHNNGNVMVANRAHNETEYEGELSGYTIWDSQMKSVKERVVFKEEVKHISWSPVGAAVMTTVDLDGKEIKEVHRGVGDRVFDAVDYKAGKDLDMLDEQVGIDMIPKGSYAQGVKLKWVKDLDIKDKRLKVLAAGSFRRDRVEDKYYSPVQFANHIFVESLTADKAGNPKISTESLFEVLKNVRGEECVFDLEKAKIKGLRDESISKLMRLELCLCTLNDEEELRKKMKRSEVEMVKKEQEERKDRLRGFIKGFVDR